MLINAEPNKAMSIPFIPVLANIMGPQGIFIMFVLLLLFGAKKLPELAKGLGQAIREFSKAKSEISDEIMREAEARPTPSRQIDTPPTVAQATGTHTSPASQTVSQSTVPHDHV